MFCGLQPRGAKPNIQGVAARSATIKKVLRPITSIAVAEGIVSCKAVYSIAILAEVMSVLEDNSVNGLAYDILSGVVTGAPKIQVKFAQLGAAYTEVIEWQHMWVQGASQPEPQFALNRKSPTLFTAA